VSVRHTSTEPLYKPAPAEIFPEAAAAGIENAGSGAPQPENLMFLFIDNIPL
jgi:hypothetical protein